MQRFIAWLGLLAVTLPRRALTTEEPIVHTEYGLVKGTIRKAIGIDRSVYSFFGVQYGRSPDYVFRFRPAEDPWKWYGIKDATDENRPLCVQDIDRCGRSGLQKHTFLRHIMPEMNMHENCLTMDIFTTRLSKNSENGTDLMPVIVWLHGGSLQCFASSTKLWALPAYENVVLVQVQYRLGLFGFFTTEDKWAPSNAAFHDHIKALKWVQRNIKAFGGNPNSVTLMGQSAGAVAATAQMLIPASSGLFHKVFAASGAPDVMPWAPTYGDAVERIAEQLNCSFGDYGATSTCLRNKVGASKLMNAAKKMNMEFSVLDDRSLLPGKVEDLINSESFASRVPLMMSVTNDELNFILSRRILSDIYSKGTEVTRTEVKAALHRFLAIFYPEQKVEKIGSVVMKEYCDPSVVGQKGIKLLRGLLDAISDCWFVSKAVKFAGKMKEAGAPVHFLKFAMKPSMYDSKPEEFIRLYNFTTTDHADDLLYILGFPFVTEFSEGENPVLPFNDEERELTRKYMHIIAHFAKTGFPPAELHWRQFPDYVEISTEFESKTGLLDHRMHLWNDVIYKLANGPKF